MSSVIMGCHIYLANLVPEPSWIFCHRGAGGCTGDFPTAISLDALIPYETPRGMRINLEKLVPPPGLESWSHSQSSTSGCEQGTSHDDDNLDGQGPSFVSGDLKSTDAPPVWRRLLMKWHDTVTRCGTPFGKYASAFSSGKLKLRNGRNRNLLPFGHVTVGDIDWKDSYTSSDKDALTNCLRLTVAGLNWMAGYGLGSRIPARPSTAQRSCLNNYAEKLVTLIQDCPDDESVLQTSGLFARLAGVNTDNSYPKLISSRVDVPQKCGAVNPAFALSADQHQLFGNLSSMFPMGTSMLPSRVEFKSGSRGEYIDLVAREILGGKVSLSVSALAAADIFCVPKKNPNQLRVVWNGSQISQAAARPNKPDRLANPSSLGQLESSLDRPLVASGRDGRSFYDQLFLNEELQQVMGKPEVTVSELLNWRGVADEQLNIDMLQRLLVGNGALHEDTVVTPLSRTWPMGFSHSSSVAQGVMVSSCRMAGVRDGEFLCEEGRLVEEGNRAVAVNTDDVTFFTRLSDIELNQLHDPPMHCLDDVWEQLGIEGQAEKKYDCKRSASVLGVCLRGGTSLTPLPAKLWKLLGAAIDLVDIRMCSAVEMSSFLGSLQWNDLLARPLLSSLHAVYAFCRQEQPNSIVPVWNNCVNELLLNLSLFVLFCVDLTRPWSPMVVATDASPSYGFGVTVARFNPADVRKAAGTAGSGHHHFTLCGVRRSVGDVTRPGVEHRLPATMRDFKTLLSLKAKRNAHSGQMEADAITLALKRLTRSTSYHRVRALFLVDALAVLGAARKGRSSTPTLRGSIRKSCAYILAADLRLVFGYVPSEWNPGDPPSRGCCHGRSKIRKPKRSAYTAMDVLEHRCRYVLRCMRRSSYALSLSPWLSSASS